MSDRHHRQWFVRTATFLAAVVVTQAAAAQRPASFADRLAAATRAYRDAQDSIHARAEAMRRSAPPRDSVRAGALLVQATTPLVAGTRRTLERGTTRAWTELQSLLGDSASRAVNGVALLYREDSAKSLLDLPRGHLWQARAPARGNSMVLPLLEHSVTDIILDQLGSTAAALLPSTFSLWVGGWVPARPYRAEDWENVAGMLATANAEITRACHAGAVQACTSALALTPVSDPYTEWYAARDWMVIAPTVTLDASETWQAARVDCVEQHHAEACLRIFRTRDAPLPLPVTARHSLTALALARGGPQAYARLLAAQGSPLEMLAAAASLSPDSLVSVWRTQVIASTPHAVRPRVLEATVLLGWTLVFGALAGRRRP